MNKAELKNYHKQKDSAELIKAQKAATDHLMSTLSHLPWTREAVVAGGAPREWYRQQPASDIDIFLIGTTITKTQLEFTLREAGFDVKEATRGDRYSDDSDDYGYRNPGIKWVYDGHIDWRSSVLSGAHRIKYQVIVTEFSDLSKLLGSFPVEISKFTWNHVTKKITGEPGALKDMADKTVTKTGFDYKRGKYVDKILHKFPDHKFVNLFDQSNAVSKTKGADHPYRMAAKHPENRPQPITPDQFVYWLQGFFEMANPTALNELQTTMVKDHLALVFNKLTPNRNGDVFMPKPVQWSANVDEQRRIATEVKGPVIEVTWEKDELGSASEPVYFSDKSESFKRPTFKVPLSTISAAKTLVSC